MISLKRTVILILCVVLSSGELLYQQIAAEYLPDETYIVPGDLMFGTLVSFQRPAGEGDDPCGPIHMDSLGIFYSYK